MKTAFVTGGSSDIGQEIIHRLRGGDWEVIAPSHKELDLSRLEELSGSLEKLTADVLTFDAVIHVAGVWHDAKTAYQKDLEDYSDEQIVTTMHVGLTSFMIILARLLPKVSRDGAVIGISGTFEGSGASGWLPYYTSKRGLEDLLLGLSQDYPSGPQVYGVSPSDTVTKPYERFFPQYIADAQPAAAVADTVYDLLQRPSVPSGSVITVRSGKNSLGFHE